jgi:hypothetical protein
MSSADVLDMPRRVTGSTARMITTSAAGEPAAEECDGGLLAVIQFPVWSRIRAAGLEHAALVAAEDGGLAAVHALIR